MQKFTTLTGVAAPLPMINIDTDAIIPKQFLKTILRTGLGKSLFYELRYDENGKEKPDFVLNKPAYRKAQILVAGENFGCGSSREHAPWALLDFGIRCVISTSFGDIFYNNSFKNGMHIEHKGLVWRIVQFQHVKPGKGGAFVRTKLKSLDSGAVVDETFRAGEKFARVHTEVRNVQYMYDDGTEAHFMDEESFEQFGLPRAEVAEDLLYILPSSVVQMLAVNGKPSGIQMPSSVELAVADTEPGVKGDTVSNVTKPATLETGAVVAVPLFVNIGDRIKVDPREARYISRA